MREIQEELLGILVQKEQEGYAYGGDIPAGLILETLDLLQSALSECAEIKSKMEKMSKKKDEQETSAFRYILGRIYIGAENTEKEARWLVMEIEDGDFGAEDLIVFLHTLTYSVYDTKEASLAMGSFDVGGQFVRASWFFKDLYERASALFKKCVHDL